MSPVTFSAPKPRRAMARLRALHRSPDLSHRSARYGLLAGIRPVVDGAGQLNGRVHALAACVLLSRAKAIRGIRDQAQQPQLIPAGGPHAARN